MQCLFVGEDAAEARGEAGHPLEDRLDHAVVIEQLGFARGSPGVPRRREGRGARSRHATQTEVRGDAGVLRRDDGAKQQGHTSAPCRRIVSTPESTTLSPR